MDHFFVVVPMSLPDYEKARNWCAANRLSKLNSTLSYHGPSHTLGQVLPMSEKLARLENVTDPLDLILLKTAALYVKRTANA